jgi:hypothetical protein
VRVAQKSISGAVKFSKFPGNALTVTRAVLARYLSGKPTNRDLTSFLTEHTLTVLRSKPSATTELRKNESSDTEPFDHKHYWIRGHDTQSFSSDIHEWRAAPASRGALNLYPSPCTVRIKGGCVSRGGICEMHKQWCPAPCF